MTQLPLAVRHQFRCPYPTSYQSLSLLILQLKGRVFSASMRWLTETKSFLLNLLQLLPGDSSLPIPRAPFQFRMELRIVVR